MDIYDYLKLDHDEVSKLFKQFEKADSKIRRQQIVAMICQELVLHAHSEQETFYKILEQFKTAEDEVLHGEGEHKEIEEQIKKVLTTKEFGSAWVEKVKKLKELVEHHVKEEEGKIFKRAKKVLSEYDALVIKEQMHYLKQQLVQKMKKEESLSR